MMGMISPNDLFEAAKKTMLGGEEPGTEREWMLVMNFVARNVAFEERAICLIFKRIYDVPLKDEAIEEIAAFQMEAKKQEAKKCLTTSTTGFGSGS